MMECSEVSRQLTALLYDELSPASREQIEAHLDRCAECRAEWQTHRRTLAFLERWPDAELPLDPVDLPRPRLGRHLPLRSLGIGVTASLVAFLFLLWLGADVRWGSGELTLRLGRAERTTPAPVLSEDSWRPALRELARSELRRQLQLLASDLDETFEAWDHDQRRRDAVLVRSLDDRRQQDLGRLLSVFEQSLEEAREREQHLAAALQLLLEWEARRVE